MPRLIFVASLPAAFELGPRTIVGRGADSTVQLSDQIISRHHLLIEARGPEYVLRDLGSLNGTSINGEPCLGERVLIDGDEITLGASRLRFVAEGSHTHDTLPPARTPAAAVARTPSAADVEVSPSSRAIDVQIPGAPRGFLPYDAVARDPAQLRLSYEELRMIAELTREVATERDLYRLLDKVLEALLRFVQADRGVVLLLSPNGTLEPVVARRREGSDLQIAVSSTILGRVLRDRTAILTPDAVQDFGRGSEAMGRSVFLNRISSALAVPMMHEGEIQGVVWLDSVMTARFQPQDLELASGVANQAAVFLANTLLSQRIERETRTRERLSRLLSPNVAEQVIQGKLEVVQGGLRVPSCTVFNSDIRGFTRMSEGIPPEQMIDVLNQYFERMVDIVFRHEGTLDKFMGDGLMALWGVPAAHDDDPARAVRCGLDMMDALEDFNREREQRGVFPFHIGIGIQTGPLVAGYVGSSRALSYTVIGDTANTSARLCGIAAPGQIIVADATAALLGKEFALEELPPAHLKGKEQPQRIFAVSRRAER